MDIDKHNEFKCKENSTEGTELSRTSLLQKHQPKTFQDIVGNDLTIKAIFNAVEKKKIAPLYLFTARVVQENHPWREYLPWH